MAQADPEQRSQDQSVKESMSYERSVDSILLTNAWNAFGEYISKYLRQGKGVNVPKFGTFTFSAPEVTLPGVTNPLDRDKQHRIPVFIISKEFCKGYNIKSGVYGEFGIRPYSVSWINGYVQEIKVNYTEIGVLGGVNKDVALLSVERFLRIISDKAKKSESCNFSIPHVGELIVRSKVAAVRFFDTLLSDARFMTNRSFRERNKSGDFLRTATVWGTSQKGVGSEKKPSPRSSSMVKSVAVVDKTGSDWLKRNLNIDVNSDLRGGQLSFESDVRPHTAAAKGTEVNKPKVGFIEESRPRSSGGGDSSATRRGLRGTMSDHENAFKKLTYWMRGKSFNPEDAFNYICVVNFGGRANHFSKLSREQLTDTFAKLELYFSPGEIAELFDVIDANRDGFIDVNEWKANVRHENSIVDYIRDVISRNNLHTDDILKRMDLEKKGHLLSSEDIARAFHNLEPYLSTKKCQSIAKMVLKGRPQIGAYELIELLGSKEDEAVAYDSTWFMSIVKRMANKGGALELLRSEFEKYDTRNEGILDIANFKTVLMKSSSRIDVTINEINRLTRYVEKDNKMMIDYVKFLRLVERSADNASGEDLLVKISAMLSDYLAKQELTPRELIKRVSAMTGTAGGNETEPRIKAFKFASWIQQQLMHSAQQEDLFGVVEEFDVDKDGYIDEVDLSTILNRKSFFELSRASTNRLTMTDRKSFTSSGSNGKAGGNLFPVVPISEERVEMVLRDLRKALNEQKISYVDAFKLLDMNDDGFLSIDEFSRGLDKITRFSEPVKQGFFAYLDKQKIGLVDYPRFLTVMKKSVYDKNTEVTEDNWDWQNDVIKKVRDWCIGNKMTMEDAFRTIDRDFDGFVNKQDLELFLVDVLKMSDKEVTSPRLDRLFKLMDQFKRGLIQLNDFKRAMESDFERAANLTISGGKLQFDRSTFDWRVNAKQQIGLVLSQRYENVKTSFEAISGHSTRIVYQKFKKWVEESRALTGFNLTEKLLQQLFSDLDPHKKGHLTENDWENAFGSYAWKGQLFRELEEAIYAYFMDIKSAFRFFASSGGKLDTKDASTRSAVDLEKFRVCCHLLLPQRFNNDELSYMWNTLRDSNGGSDINYLRFSILFDSHSFRGTKRIQSPARTLSINSSGSRLTKATLPRPATYGTPVVDYNIGWQENIIDKLRMILPSTQKKLDDVFKEYDKFNLGKVSERDFRNGLRNLNLGLSLKEIDQLLNVCELDAEGYVNWRKFCEKFKPRELDSRILERSKSRLIKLKENVYSFLLSPKDAFRLFNEDRTGKLTFEQFNKFIVKVSQLAHEDIPSFAIVRDLFDFFDIRKDGVIDMNEWMQTFKMVEDNSFFQPKGQTKVVSIYPQSAVFSTNTLHLTQWGQTKEYEQILRFVGKNRKAIMETFAQLEGQKVALTFEKVKSILAEVLLKGSLAVPEKNWPLLLKFAEKDGIIDYKFMMEVFKERLDIVLSHPKERS